MFYIYHIPKRGEWGCTINLERRLKTLDYKFSDLDRVITVGNINKAADMERELNIEYGYGWNISQDYRKISLRRIGTNHTNASKMKISKSKLGKPSNHSGIKHTEETKNKIREQFENPILVNNIQFKSQKEAAKFIGVTCAAISIALKNNKKCKGFELKAIN